MRISDDYDAKFEIWAKDPKIYPELKGPPLPKFGHKSFSTYEEFNRWKQEMTDRIAEELSKPTDE